MGSKGRGDKPFTRNSVILLGAFHVKQSQGSFHMFHVEQGEGLAKKIWLRHWPLVGRPSRPLSQCLPIVPIYFPTQNSRKITSSTSSTSTRPVSLPRPVRAWRKSSATSSSPEPCSAFATAS